MTPCRIYATEGDHPTSPARELMLGLGDPFNYLKCEACGCPQMEAIPHDMARFYPADYYSLRTPHVDRRFVRAMKQARDVFEVTGRGILGRIVDYLASSIYMRGLRIPGISRESRILDLGCGAGQNTVALGDAGFRNVCGTDPFIEADIHHPNGVEIRKADANDLDAEWAAIYMHHSFERVNDPHSTLNAVARLLAPSGTLTVSMPVVPCEAWERYGLWWGAMDAPRQLRIHSIRSM
jgi:SAM-dependent methyltransferase